MKSMKLPNRLQKGFSLVEIMLVLGLVAVFIGVVFMTYSKVKSNSDVNTEVQNITAIQGGIHRLYASQSNFTGLSNAVIIAANIPANTTFTPGSTTITNRWGGSVVAAPSAAPATTYTITTDTVPQTECTDLASELAGNFRQVSINGTVVKDMVAGPVVIDIASTISFTTVPLMDT